jgi:hypothetical protein
MVFENAVVKMASEYLQEHKGSDESISMCLRVIRGTKLELSH